MLQGAFEDTADAAARIFVWLRYSSARKLTWQRNYNTQPRILGEAQAKLTQMVGEVRSPFATLNLLVSGRHRSVILYHRTAAAQIYWQHSQKSRQHKSSTSLCQWRC